MTLQSDIGPFDLIDHSRLHIFNRTRWINHCGCIDGHQDEEQCIGNFESSFSFEVLGLPSGQIPGFTLSYKQYGAPELLRLSTFPDTGIADSWRFGQSSHYRSPLLRLQKALRPSSTLVSVLPSSSSSSFSFPSATSSASFPSYTYLEHTPEDPTLSGVAGQSKQSSFLGVAAAGHTGLEKCNPRHTSRCHLSDALASLGHGLEVVGMKAKSGAQSFLGKIQDADWRRLQKQQTLQTPPSAIAKEKDEFIDDHVVAHDELVDDNVQWQQDRMEDFLMLDLSPSSWKIDNSAAVKAFQVTSLVFIIVALSGSLYALARRNPRLRAQWATVLEERRNRRLYKQAACKQRFQTFFSHFRLSSAAEKASTFTHHPDTILDWQGWEKRTSVENTRHDQKIDSHELRQDLLAFRKAHQFVDGILSAEEGRLSSSRQARRERCISRVRHQRTWSFGSEKTAPPAYESEGEELILDVDGPRYVVLGHGFAKSSPDSSVISTSPRTSCVDSDSEADEKF